MRKMTKGDANITLRVVEHIMLKNMWEYYILEDEQGEDPDSDVKYALVMGDYDEIGTVSLSEIEPYIISRTTNLNSLFPASGYQWADEVMV